MKSLLKTSFLVLGLSISAFAADLVPTDTKGGATQPNYAGVSTCVVGPSTGTTALLCTTGAGIILQIIDASTAAANALVLRDSATANTASSSLTVINQGSIAGTYIYPRFKNGLSVNALSAPAANEAWTIIYTKPN